VRDCEDAEIAAAFMLGAAPAITSAPQFRQTAPTSAGDVIIVIVGIMAIVVFGAVLIVLWNRFDARPADTSTSRTS
jgi:hypothetical protein